MFTRRQFVAGAAATLAGAPAIVRAQGVWRSYPFSLGVASGEPAPDGFVIWTRLAPEPLEQHGGMAMSPVPVAWEVGADDRFATIVARGEATARPELGHAVHVEVAGLAPDRPYWYRFTASGERSIHGRARTLPRPGSSPAALRFGVCGCQNWEDGYYTAYRHMAQEELAFVYHYGDYIYEYRGNAVRPGWSGNLVAPVRQHAGQLIVDLADYRRRYAQYKTDPDLQRAHAAHSFFMSYDDHEIDNDWVSDIDDQSDTPPEVFRLRQWAAFQAWYEHMPVRRAQFPRALPLRNYRTARYGDLAALHLLDTRAFRSDQPCGGGFAPVCPDTAKPDATVLGAEQESWLLRSSRQDPARWNVLAQQVMMMSLDRRTREEPAPIRNMDSWAGYDVPRRRLLSAMRGVENVIVLTGDEHQNFAGLLHDGDRPAAVEFVATSISSGGDGWDLRNGSDRIIAANPQVKFVNDQRGYLACEVTPEEWRTHYMVMDRVSSPGGALTRRATWAVARGEVDLRQA